MSFWTSAEGQSVHLYRKPVQTRNRLGKNPPKHRLPILYGYDYIGEIVGAVIAPRTTNNVNAAPPEAPQAHTGKTMYCETDTDVYSGDLIVHEDVAGRLQTYRVEGEDENSYVSPYSGFYGGREIFLQRVRYQRD